MAHEIQDKAAWKRLALLLVARRHELGYRKRSWFVDAHIDQLRHGRTIDAAETAERMNLDANSFTLIESVYQWKPGSIDAVLRGGEPRPIEEGVAGVADPSPDPFVFDRMECRFIIDRLDRDQLTEALALLRGIERRQH